MRSDERNFGLSIGFMGGFLIGFLLVNAQKIEIETKINIVDLFTALFTAFIGYYLATSIQSFKTRSISFVGYLQPKLDLIYNDFESFKKIHLQFQNKLEIKYLIKHTKSFYLQIESVKCAYNTFDVPIVNLEHFEGSYDAFEKYLQTLPTASNEIELIWDPIKYNQLIEEITNQYFKLIKELHERL